MLPMVYQGIPQCVLTKRVQEPPYRVNFRTVLGSFHRCLAGFRIVRLRHARLLVFPKRIDTHLYWLDELVGIVEDGYVLLSQDFCTLS